MEIINLTSQYETHILQHNDLLAYEKTYPALFRHYFQYWADRSRFAPTLNAVQTRKRETLIVASLDHIESRLSAHGLDPRRLRIVLFVGQNTSNGHAFKDGLDFVVWIPVETYQTTPDVEVFVTHEIIHALHYVRSSEFYFNNLVGKQLVWRQLITEGLATYLTKTVLNVDDGVALWADYLPPEAIKDWLGWCCDREQELKKYLLENFSSSSSEVGLFYARDRQDIFQYRGGYYIGLKFIGWLEHKNNLTADRLLTIPKEEYKSLALEYLRA